MQVLSCANTTPAYGATGSVPVLNVAIGETFCIETNDRFEMMPGGGQPDPEIVRALIGPVHVEGIAAGDTLAIEIVDITPRTDCGYLLASSRFGLLGDQVATRAKVIPIRGDQVFLTDQTTIRYAPMIGKIGVAPDRPEPGTATGAFGGALSCIQIAPGATLYVKAARDGAGVCLEDVHAAMGDGEATASAVEMAASVTLRCTRYEGPVLPLPALTNADELVVFAKGDTADIAARAATDALLEALMTHRDIDLTEAALIVGAAGDVRLSFIGSTPVQARAAIARHLSGI